MGEFAIGQSVPRFEDPRLVRGGGRYVADMTLPRMAMASCCARRMRMRKFSPSTPTAAKAAPGVLAVLTGADWEASGFGDMPRANQRERKDGRPMYKPANPGLVKDRVRWVGDYVAFVVAETYHQAADAAELIEVEYETLPAITNTAEAAKPGAPLVWDDCENNIIFEMSVGNKTATDAAFEKADHIVKHHFVINRVTAATMEPRACIGDYNATDNHYTCYTTLQRAHVYRGELAKEVLKVPESNVRVVAGDIGGSFGMKSSVTPEVGLVLLASKLVGRPVKWVSTRSEAFLSDAQARDNVTDAELALDKKGNFLGMRFRTIANIGAYAQASSDAFPGKFWNAGRRLQNARDPRRTDGRHDKHASDAALSRQRPPGGGLCQRAADRSRRRRTRTSIRWSSAAATLFRRRRCRSRPGSPSLTTAASSKRTWIWR